MDTTEAVKAIKDWALDAYEQGGDVIVEAFTDDEIVEQFIAEQTGWGGTPRRLAATSIDEALTRAKAFCGIRKEYGDDIRAA